MPTFTTFHDQKNSRSGAINHASDWRCTCCGKLLGRRHGAAILVQFARGHRYRISRPASAVCRSCGTLNET
ncbi:MULTISPECIES: hypothetical protein [Roseovarius]|uniref:hypothetical protein n=1 Tax=Roseovarius TaxID=74030 RepID=UPI000CDD1637|nr:MULTISPECIES: hypothetical protein [Roseovarius]